MLNVNKIATYFGLRHVSTQFVRPRPRPYKRRLYEAALVPVLPRRLEKEWKSLNDPLNIYASSEPHHEQFNENEEMFTAYELAQVDRTRQWIREEGFRAMAICQISFVKEETFWLGKNQFRLNGLEFCDIPCKILKRLFEQTPFHPLNSMFIDECTRIVFGRNMESMGKMVSECSRYSWITPICFAYDNRLLMTEQAKELTGPEPMERLRLQTAQILDSSTRQIPDSLDRVVGQLTRTLDAHLAAHS